MLRLDALVPALQAAFLAALPDGLVARPVPDGMAAFARRAPRRLPVLRSQVLRLPALPPRVSVQSVPQAARVQWVARTAQPVVLLQLAPLQASWPLALRAQLPAPPVLQALTPVWPQALPLQDAPESRVAPGQHPVSQPQARALAWERFPAPPQVSPLQAPPRALPALALHEPPVELRALPPQRPERPPRVAQASPLPPLPLRLSPLPRQLPSPPIPENAFAPIRHGSSQSNSSASSSL